MIFLNFRLLSTFRGIIRLSCFPFLSIFLEMQKLLFHKPHFIDEIVIVIVFILGKNFFLEK